MITKKTILYLITQSELGGAQTYVFDLAKNLKDEYNIIVAFGEQGSEGDLAKKLTTENIKYYPIPHLKRAISPINDIIALFEIKRLIKKEKPNIIHLNSTKISILGSLATKSIAKNKKIKVIYTAHGWVFNEPMSNIKKLFYKFTEKFTAFLKNKIICVSEFDRKVALKEKITPEKKLITIHNGIKKIDFLTKEKARKELSLDPQKFTIGTIGYFYKNKGYEYLTESLLLLTNKNIDFQAVIIGKSGPEKENIQSSIKQYKLKNKIKIASPNGAAKYLKAFDIYVCSSVKEGLSYTIIEAMQAGLPIIATKVGGNPELIKNNENGILIEPKNANQISEAILTLMNNEEMRKKLADKAKSVAEKNFTFEKMLEETKTIYK